MDFEKHVSKICGNFTFKETLSERDIILFIMPDIALFGFVHSIERDFTKKIEWWHITYSIFSLPMVGGVLTLRTPQMTGKETFTMGGEQRFFAPIDIDSYSKVKPKKLESVKKKPTLKLIK